MATVGIVAEFNPLHSGHEYLISEAKRYGSVVAVISSSFVQRGDTAIASKEIRTRAALTAGVDLVAELPVLWSMSTAQNFALGGIGALIDLGCDTIIFGSETGEIEPLLRIADILESNEFSCLVEQYLSRGITFAAARQRACEELGAPQGILDKPNNNLGIEYIVAARRLGAKPIFKTVKRRGAHHDSGDLGEFVSASLLREKLLKGDRKLCEKYMNKDILKLFSEDKLSDIKNIEKGILSVLRTKTVEDLKKLPDLSEGVENKLYSGIRQANSLEELYDKIKVKRYPMARVRRLVLSAFLGMDKDYFMKPLPYVRILGFNKNGSEIIKRAKKLSSVPIVTRVGDIKNEKVFITESRACDLYGLSLKASQPCGNEYTLKLVKLEE